MDWKDLKQAWLFIGNPDVFIDAMLINQLVLALNSGVSKRAFVRTTVVWFSYWGCGSD
jgi:hypothetical protein